ncbi:hypothetical protein NIES2104_20350 [Leptolyngbya sp. NIES-2104]|nr:hypothetical protein NIES2104_20350 [Leptolyngbya sp. NIES-2104]
MIPSLVATSIFHGLGWLWFLGFPCSGEKPNEYEYSGLSGAV